MESSEHQATLGKMALGLKVTDLAGHRLTFPRATGRFFESLYRSPSPSSSSVVLLVTYLSEHKFDWDWVFFVGLKFKPAS